MDRRQYLEASAIGLVSIGLAGCLGDDGGADEPNSDDDDAFGDTIGGDYERVARWLPAPSHFESDGLAVLSKAPAALAEKDDAFEDGALEPIRDDLERFGVGSLAVADVDRLVLVEFPDSDDSSPMGFGVVEGNIDPDAVGTTLEDNGLEPDGREDGYDYYDSDEAAYAVADGSVVASIDTTIARSVVENVVAAERGDIERYAEERAAFGRLVDQLPAGHMALTFGQGTIFETEDVENPIVEAATIDGAVTEIREDTAHTGFVILLEDDSDVEDADVESLLDSNGGLELDDLEYGIDGSVVWIYGTEPASEFDARL